MARTKTVTIKQDPDKEVRTEVLAQAIVDIADGMKTLRNGRLNDRALILLIQDNSKSKLSRADISAVLDSIEGLEAAYVRKRRS